jgi:uncharacterized protein YuzE
MTTYSDDIDILYVQLSDSPIAETDVIDDGRFVDFAADGSVVGAEFIGARAGIDLRGLPERERLEELVKVLRFPVLV